MKFHHLFFFVVPDVLVWRQVKDQQKLLERPASSFTEQLFPKLESLRKEKNGLSCLPFYLKELLLINWKAVSAPTCSVQTAGHKASVPDIFPSFWFCQINDFHQQSSAEKQKQLEIWPQRPSTSLPPSAMHYGGRGLACSVGVEWHIQWRMAHFIGGGG